MSVSTKVVKIDIISGNLICGNQCKFRGTTRMGLVSVCMLFNDSSTSSGRVELEISDGERCLEGFAMRCQACLDATARR